MRHVFRALSSWSGRLALFVALCCLGTALPAANKYYVLNPEHLSGDLKIISMEAGNTITWGLRSQPLNQYETYAIPAADLQPGLLISGTKFFAVGSNENAADLLVPDTFAGTSFVVPHIAGQHKYFLLSPVGTANVTVRLGTSVDTFAISQGQAIEYDAGSDNAIAGRITSDVNILVSHVAYSGPTPTPQDAYPVPPAATTLYGIKSQNTVVAASADATTVTVNASGGGTGSYSLNAGQKAVVTQGSGTTQGQGSALKLSANLPIAAVQYDDGDGSDATAFWDAGRFAKRHGIPVNAQYVVALCNAASVSVTLYRGSTAPQTQTCNGSATTPSKVYFGAATSGNNVAEGWYLIASAAVYVMYEDAATEDEHNLLGFTPAAGPAAPTLTAVASPTTNNPQTIAGTGAGASKTVRLYVNGKLQQSTTSTAGGTFSFAAELYDGPNQVYATVFATTESNPSNVLAITYNNIYPRSLSTTTISGTQVWTPGSPAQAYTLTGPLTIAAGGKIVLMPGTRIESISGASITVNGTFKVSGTVTQPVVLTGTSALSGSWDGVKVLSGSTNTSMDYVTIDYAVVGIEVNAASAVIRNSVVRNFSSRGIYFNASTAGTELRSTTIENLAYNVPCVEIYAASPLVSGNTIHTCSSGLLINANSSPTVNGGNDIYDNSYNIQVNGLTGVANPAPVITGNRIQAPHGSTYNYVASNFTNGNTTVLNATGNWWGSSVPADIAVSIVDYTDNDTSDTTPFVDYGSYLNGPYGTAVVGNFLTGLLTATTTTLASGTTYDALGSIRVQMGRTLVIQAGAILRVHALDAAINVEGGTLTVTGTSTNTAQLTSGLAVPMPGAWQGIRVRSGTTSIITGALIEWASLGVDISSGAKANVVDSTIRKFASAGVQLTDSTSTTQITDNTIDGNNQSPIGITLQSASPTISGNIVRNCNTGILIVSTSAAQISGGNQITGNYYGFGLNGNSGGSSTNPQPVVTGNQIYGNTSLNVYTSNYFDGASVVLNFTQNWWGTAEPAEIGASISDHTDDVWLPTVNYADFLNGPGGISVPGNYLNGVLTATSTTLTAGQTYDLLGSLTVPAGKTLVVPAGTTLRSHVANASLFVSGSLQINGTSTQSVLLTSGRTTKARGDWRGIEVNGGTASISYATIEYAIDGIRLTNASGTVANSTIRLFATNGIAVDSPSGAVQLTANTIDGGNLAASCIYLYLASPTISGNVIRNCSTGILVNLNSTSSITGNNQITGNTYGIYLAGDSASGTNNPQPVVTGNQILGNTTYNVMAAGYFNGSAVTLNFTQNWWGTTEPAVVGASIYDHSDDVSSATVNYASYLNGPAGTPVAGNYLNGLLTATTTTLTAGAIYDLLGTLVVPAGKTLVIPAGTTVRGHVANTGISVEGTLQVNGTSSQPVLLTSGRTTKARGDWRGIEAPVSGGSIAINYATIEYAAVGASILNGGGSIANSTIRSFSNYGIYIKSPTAAVSLSVNTIDGIDQAVPCIFLESASPAISGNTVRNCSNGISVYLSSTATINGNNKVTANNVGIALFGDAATSGNNPLPVVTGNQIYGNTNYNVIAYGYFNGPGVTLNFTQNWWGTTNLTAIANSISDLADNPAATDLPIINWSSVLTSAGGSVLTRNYLIGSLSAATTTLTAGAAYDVLGLLVLPAGKTLNVSAGTTVRFHGTAARLQVSGTLHVNGTSTAKAVFTSGRDVPQRGDWEGVVVLPGATATTFDFGIFEYATNAINVTTASVAIRDSIFRRYSNAGIRMDGVPNTAEVRRNYLDNEDNQAYGIYLLNSSPTIANNKIHRNQFGIYITGNSQPTITANTIAFDTYGIYLDGDGTDSATSNPRPTITGNDLFGNVLSQLQIANYGSSSPIVITATGNWWGTATPTLGNQILLTGTTASSVVNFSGAASSALTGSVSSAVSVSEPYFSPNGNGVKDTTTFAATLSTSSAWTVNVRNSAGAVVRTYTGTGTAISAVWNGRNGSNVLQADDAYNFELTLGAGSALAAYVAATLDNTAPAGSLSAPTSGATLRNVLSVPVVGSATDLNFSSYDISYGAGASPSSWTSIGSGGTVTAALLGTWLVSTVDDTGIVPNGLYQLRLTVSDMAGNVTTVTQPNTIDNVAFSAISIPDVTINPLVGQQATINFTLSKPATVYLRIYPEQGGALVKETSQVFSTGGAQSMTWNGKSASGAFLPDEAYVMVLYASDGTAVGTYDPPIPSIRGAGSGVIDSYFNTHQNDFWKVDYTMGYRGRVRLYVNTCIPSTGTPVLSIPHDAGAFSVMWDGRDADGNIAQGTCDFYFDAPQFLKANAVILQGNAPKITGNGDSPRVEVQSTPWLIRHSFEQISKITYRIDQDSTVTVKLLPPGINDPSSSQAIVLVNAQAQLALSGGQPLDHDVEWRGYDSADTNNISVSTEGTYTFWISATSAATGVQSIYRGALQLYQ